MKTFCYGVLLCAAISLPLNLWAVEHRQTSPDGTIALTLYYDKAAGSVAYGVSRDGIEIVAPSALGLKLNTATMNTFPSGLSVARGAASESYAMPHGKKIECTDNYNEITLTGTASQKQRNLTVRFRVYDDGVAFRYELENRKGNVITADLSEFNFKDFERAYAQRYHSDYSWYYENRDWDAMIQEAAYNVPALVKCGADTYTLLTEAASTPAMAASRLVAGMQTGQFIMQPAADSEIDDSQFVSPWRVMIIGSLPRIVESTMITALNQPTLIDDLDWIKPGRVAWNWGAEDGDSSPTPEQACRYIDFAAAMGWEYFLLDDGWDGRINLTDVIDYANQRGVDLLLWSHQNRFLNDYDHIYSWLSYWKSLGVKGVKIDFFEDDSQLMLRKYDKMLRAAADCRMMLNFHGCTKPSGLERTWPHLMTSEAVLGGEFYMFNSTMTPGSHTVNLALTRNVLGSMDYTPVKFGNKHGRVITDTSWAYQLALATLFESALQSICDNPGNILGSMAEPALRRLPVAWDETRCLEAESDQYVTLARRSGDDWWVASVTSSPREISIPLDFLRDDDVRYAHIYAEGDHRSDIAYECREVRKGETITLPAGKDSGATVILTGDATFPRPFNLKFEAEKYNRYCQRVEDASCSGGAWLDGIGGQRKMIQIPRVEVPEGGEYNLTLFYIAKGERDAYIQANDGEKFYHHFRDTGGRIYFMTVPVTLIPGTNQITIGNESATAPGFDRLVISRIINGEPGHASASSLAADALRDINVINGQIVVNCLEAAKVTLYRFDGSKIKSMDINGGTTSIAPGFTGGCIVNVSVGAASVSKKITIK